MKKNRYSRFLSNSIVESLSTFSPEKICDICIVLSQALPQGVKVILNDMGITISNIPKHIKRLYFSNISNSKKYRYKDQILISLKKYNDVSAAHTFKKLFLSTVHCWANKLDELGSSCGITINETHIPSNLRVLKGIDQVVQSVNSLRNLDTEHKMIKTAVMSETVKKCSISTDDRGCIQSLVSTFGVHKSTAKRVILDTEKGKSTHDILKRAKRKEVKDTKWPEIIKKFCLTKPICREAPGESVSVSYGERAEKFIRQFSVSEIFNFFLVKHPEFPYQLSTFRTLVAKNLVAPSLRDVKRNTCPLHENVKRCIKALNRFLIKNKAKELCVPQSTLDICLYLICKPCHTDQNDKTNPLNWNPICTKGECSDCGPNNWMEIFVRNIKEKK